MKFFTILPLLLTFYCASYAQSDTTTCLDLSYANVVYGLKNPHIPVEEKEQLFLLYTTLSCGGFETAPCWKTDPLTAQSDLSPEYFQRLLDEYVRPAIAEGNQKIIEEYVLEKKVIATEEVPYRPYKLYILEWLYGETGDEEWIIKSFELDGGREELARGGFDGHSEEIFTKNITFLVNNPAVMQELDVFEIYRYYLTQERDPVLGQTIFLSIDYDDLENYERNFLLMQESTYQHPMIATRLWDGLELCNNKREDIASVLRYATLFDFQPAKVWVGGNMEEIKRWGSCIPLTTNTSQCLFDDRGKAFRRICRHFDIDGNSEDNYWTWLLNLVSDS